MREEIALTGGRWVATSRSVRVWMPTVEIEQQRPDVHHLIACPTCHAAIHERCRTRAGKQRQGHSTRLMSRRCLCGNPIPNRRGQKWCAECKTAARREQQRLADSKRVEKKRAYDRARRAA